MWDERYSGKEYVYGTEPNSFLSEHAGELVGPVLSLAEGEGRNAVFLASLGMNVLGVDSSRVGLEKAHALAESKGVKIQIEVADLALFKPRENFFNSVISISAHLPGMTRKTLYPLIEICLMPGGILLLEAYSENQVSRNTGGPKDLDMLMTVEKIKREFPNLEPVLLREIEREIQEGKYHTGIASVVQFIGKKA